MSAAKCDPVERVCYCQVAHPWLYAAAVWSGLWLLLPGRAQGRLTGPPCFEGLLWDAT